MKSQEVGKPLTVLEQVVVYGFIYLFVGICVIGYVKKSVVTDVNKGSFYNFIERVFVRGREG
jgi:hypothetical protein